MCGAMWYYVVLCSVIKIEIKWVSGMIFNFKGWCRDTEDSDMPAFRKGEALCHEMFIDANGHFWNMM